MIRTLVFKSNHSDLLQLIAVIEHINVKLFILHLNN